MFNSHGSIPGVVNYFCTHKEKNIWATTAELNCLVCRLRAVLPILVGLCWYSFICPLVFLITGLICALMNYYCLYSMISLVVNIFTGYDNSRFRNIG